jgi:hypothetical protein
LLPVHPQYHSTAFGSNGEARTQSAEFAAGERVDRGYAALEPRDVQPRVGEVDLLPAEGT